MLQVDAPGDVLDEIILGSARGGKAGPPLAVTVIRELEEGDLPALQAPAPVGAIVPSLLVVRSIHHQLAQLLAKGESNENAGLITGYSPTYISNLKRDPTFVELMSHYEVERELIFADAVEQCRILGLSFKEELQARLESNPAGFTSREVLEAMKLLLVDMRPQVPGGGLGASAGINIQVSFEQQQGKSLAGVGDDSPSIEVEFAEILSQEK